MLTRMRRPYLSNDCSLFHCVRQGWPSQGLLGIMVRIIPEASLTAPEDECLACMLTRKRRPYLSNDCSLFHCVRQGWPSQDYEGIIVRIIPEASLTAPEDECLACMLTRKRRPYLSNDCSLFHCVRQGWPSQDYEE